jgi:hypothetical protein
MTTLNDYFTYTIAAHWLAPIFNSDFSGLSDEEEKQFFDFLETAGNVGFGNLRDATWSMADENEEPHFSRCEISGLHSDCYTMRLYFTNGNRATPDFPVTAHNHETNETNVFYSLQEFIDYLNERDDWHTYSTMEKTA